MPKGDAARTQTSIDQQGGNAQNKLTNTFNNLLPQNQQLQNRYNVAADLGQQDYGNIMNQYQNLFSNANNSYNNLYGQTQNSFGPQRDVYNQFAQTGGYSLQDVQDLRARGIAPTRAVYQNAQDNIDRQRSLSGGYSPNYTAASAKLARDMSQGISDTNVNVNAQLADAIRQGKLAGAAGLNQTDTSQLGMLSNVLGGQNTALNSALGGARSLYGTAPGPASMYGSQLGQSNDQMNQLQQLQQQLAQLIIGSQQAKSQQPGNFDIALGRIGSTIGLGGKVLGGLGGLNSGGGGAGIPGLPGGTSGSF